MAVILASGGMVMIVVAAVFIGIAVLLHLGNQADRKRRSNIAHCTGVCVPDRSNMLTGAYTEDRPAYGQGNWQPTRHEAGAVVRDVSTSTPYGGRIATAPVRGQMTNPQHGEEWDYPVMIPERAGDAPIPVEWGRREEVRR